MDLADVLAIAYTVDEWRILANPRVYHSEEGARKAAKKKCESMDIWGDSFGPVKVYEITLKFQPNLHGGIYASTHRKRLVAQFVPEAITWKEEEINEQPV